MDAVPELDERMPIEPDERDVAADRLVDERLRRRPECLPLGEPDEPLHLRGEVEEDVGIVGRDQVVDEGDRHPARLEPDRLLAVLVDAVVLAGRPGRPRLAMTDVGPGQVLELERDVLGDVADPRPLAQAGDEAAAATERAGMVLERRQQRDERVGEVREQVRWVLLEDAEVDQQPDDGLACPVVGTAQDARLEDAQGRRAAQTSAPRRTSRRDVAAAVLGDVSSVRGAGSACATSASCSLRTPSVSARSPVDACADGGAVRRGLGGGVRWRLR